MAHYQRTIQVDQSPETVFDYLADFSHAAEWDPGVSRSTMTTPEPLGVGSRFEVVVRFLGSESAYHYEIIGFDRPHRLVLRAERPKITSEDTISVVTGRGGRTSVTYDADLRLTGMFRFFDPVLTLAFRRVGDRAIRGLGETLATDHLTSR